MTLYGEEDMLIPPPVETSERQATLRYIRHILSPDNLFPLKFDFIKSHMMSESLDLCG